MTEPKKYWAVVDEKGEIWGACMSYMQAEMDAEDRSRLMGKHHRVIPVAIVPYGGHEYTGSITKADVMRAAKASTAKLKEIGAYKEQSVMEETGHEDR